MRDKWGGRYSGCRSVFIVTDNTNLEGEEVEGVGVMKDEVLKLEEIEVPHTLGGSVRSYDDDISLVVYYEVIRRDLNRRRIYECRFDERLKGKDERSTLLTYTGFHGGLEHLMTETRLIDEMFTSVMGECVIYFIYYY